MIIISGKIAKSRPEFAGEDAEASLTLNGEKLDAKQIKLEDQTISAELTEEQVKANGGKEVVLKL